MSTFRFVTISGVALSVSRLIISVPVCNGFSPAHQSNVYHRKSLRQMQAFMISSVDNVGSAFGDSDLENLTTPILKEQLRLLGLPVSGNKPVLIGRLLSHRLQQHEQDTLNSTSILSKDDEEITRNDESFDTSSPPSTFHSAASFEDLGIHSCVLPAIRAQPGWHQPTPVQRLAIPKLIRQDVQNYDDGGNQFNNNNEPPDSFWCEAPTGSGKTAAYAIPLLQNLLLRRKLQHRRKMESSILEMEECVSALILCPTRELAVQIGTVVNQLASNLSVKGNYKRKEQNARKVTAISTMVVHGGVPYEPQVAQLADIARYNEALDVLVATPGRLVDLLTRYAEEGGDRSAQDASIERRLLKAFDEYGDDVTLEQLQAIGLDDLSNPDGNDNFDDGRGSLISILNGLQYVVLDEVDRLLGKGFQEDLDRLMELLPRAVPVSEPGGDINSVRAPAIWMFSATFPKSIEPRLDQVLARIGATKSPVRVQCFNSDRVLSDDVPVSSSLQKKLERATTVTSANSFHQIGPASTIELRTIRLEKPARTQALRKLLEEDYKNAWDRVLVFVATRYASEHVSRKLRRAGIKSSELHGKLDQDARMRRLDDLKRGKIRVLLSTDIASRGIDISGLSAVVNYDLPRSTSDFVHRIGRTGRAGKEGMAVTFVTPADEAHMELIEQRHLTNPTEREVLEGFEPNEERWNIQSQGARISTPGVTHSSKGLVHDRMFGGIKGRKKSKKDRQREAAAREAAGQRTR